MDQQTYLISSPPKTMLKSKKMYKVCWLLLWRTLVEPKRKEKIIQDCTLYSIFLLSHAFVHSSHHCHRRCHSHCSSAFHTSNEVIIIIDWLKRWKQIYWASYDRFGDRQRARIGHVCNHYQHGNVVCKRKCYAIKRRRMKTKAKQRSERKKLVRSHVPIVLELAKTPS